jgi:hypothetical protein
MMVETAANIEAHKHDISRRNQTSELLVPAIPARSGSEPQGKL